MNTMNAEKRDIRNIESIQEWQARHLAVTGEIIPNIKDDYTLYLVDLGESFGYSCLVFADGHHIHYANDYELHHRYSNMTRDQLRDHYIRRAERILFSEDEIGSPLKDYEEYELREYFLHNYYGMRRNHQSIFGCSDRKPNTIYNQIAFAYYDMKDKDFVVHHGELYLKLIKAREAMKDSLEYWIGAFYYEMCNHEYGINWSADWDTLGAFGNLNAFSSECPVTEYFDALGFNDMQREAYYKARNKYFDNHTDF